MRNSSRRTRVPAVPVFAGMQTAPGRVRPLSLFTKPCGVSVTLNQFAMWGAQRCAWLQGEYDEEPPENYAY